MHQEAHLILHSPDNRITGNGSCNNFSGSFELGSQNQISFTQMISTRMACPDMEVEDQLLKVFESADSFSLNKDTLSLLKSGMAAPLARFVAIYFN
jgi:heat shock protein HslJ